LPGEQIGRIRRIVSVVNVTETVEPHPGLRERKKAATRQALYEAALRLAVERGPEAVTVEAIADEANVSRRTFSNYFASKEEAFFHGEQVRTASLVELVRSRPPDEPPWRALTAATLTGYADLRDVDPRWLAQLQLIRRHPSLVAGQIANMTELELALAEEISARQGDPDPLKARIMAAAFLSTLRVVFTTWAEQGGPAPLGETLESGLAAAGSRFE
jgi:AcrR family transcriptional regulator